MIEIKNYSKHFGDSSIYENVNLNLEFGKSYALD
jgi:ABC-type multidrug transport system ATPase subunit